MAQWSDTTKHEKSTINHGNQYEIGDHVTRQALNAIVENSFYAMRVAEESGGGSQNVIISSSTPLASGYQNVLREDGTHFNTAQAYISYISGLNILNNSLMSSDTNITLTFVHTTLDSCIFLKESDTLFRVVKNHTQFFKKAINVFYENHNYPSRYVSSISETGMVLTSLESVEKEYELIEKIIVGYSVLTTQPSDWSTNYMNYFKTNGKEPNDVDFAYVALTSAETFVIGKYFKYEPSITTSSVVRTFSTNSLKKFAVVITDATIDASHFARVYVGTPQYQTTLQKLIYGASGSKVFYFNYKSLSKNLGKLIFGNAPRNQSLGDSANARTEICWNNYIDHKPLTNADEINRLEIQTNQTGGFTAGAVIYIYGS